MFASLMSDALQGLGCVTFSFALMAGAGALLALRCGLLPGLAGWLRRLGAGPPADDGGARL